MQEPKKKIVINKSRVTQFIETDITSSVALSKLVHSQETIRKTNEPVAEHDMLKLMNQVGCNESEAKHILSIFPDVELAIEIMVSLILSPKDLARVKLNYRSKTQLLPPTLTSNLLRYVDNYLETNYKLSYNLNRKTREQLAGSGAWVQVVIPENVLDDIINGKVTISKESMSCLFDDDYVKGIGILGKDGSLTHGPGLESLMAKPDCQYSKPKLYTKTDSTIDIAALTGIEITDNIHLLKLPSILESTRRSTLSDLLNPAIESVFPTHAIYKDITSGKDTDAPQLNISTTNPTRKTVGKPLNIRFPTSSLITVYPPGDPENHVGYYGLINQDGYPIDVNKDVKDRDELVDMVNENIIGETLLSKAATGLRGKSKRKGDETIRLFEQTMERTLENRVNNGIYNQQLVLGGNNSLYLTAFSRVLSSKNTRLLYIPAELVSYCALKYDDNGIGKNALSDYSVLASMRAALMFSKVSGSILNSIPQTNVHMNLDPKDPDPTDTIHKAMSEVLKTKKQLLPVGLHNPSDMVQWAQEAGFTFTFSDHPKLPATSFEFTDNSGKRTLPDDTMADELRDAMLLAIGPSKDMLDSDVPTDFASTADARRILLLKRVLLMQDAVVNNETKYAKILLINDGIVIKEIRELIEQSITDIKSSLTKEDKVALKSNKEEFIKGLVLRFIDSIELELPAPNSTSFSDLKDEFDAYKDALEYGIEAFISDTILSMDVAGDLVDRVTDLQDALKAHFMRQWMVEHNYMVELLDMTAVDNTGAPLIDLANLMNMHVNGLINTCMGYVKASKKTNKSTTRDLEKINNGEEEEVIDDEDTGTTTPDEKDQNDQEPAAPVEEETPPVENEETPPEEQETPPTEEK